MANFYYFKFFGHFFFKKGNIQQSVKFLEEKIHHQKKKATPKNKYDFFSNHMCNLDQYFFNILFFARNRN